jgi:hypothetical protein
VSIEDYAHTLDHWLAEHVTYWYMVSIMDGQTVTISTHFNHIADLRYLLFAKMPDTIYPVLVVRHEAENLSDYDCVTSCKPS